MQEMRNLAADGPMPFETLRDQSWFVSDTLLYSPTRMGSKRLNLSEINTLRMRIGLMGIPAIRLRDWVRFIWHPYVLDLNSVTSAFCFRSLQA
jgi:hypothetical protein